MVLTKFYGSEFIVAITSHNWHFVCLKRVLVLSTRATTHGKHFVTQALHQNSLETCPLCLSNSYLQLSAATVPAFDSC